MKASVDQLNLSTISESNRWLIANALRAAATKYREDAKDLATIAPAVGEQFEDQALVAEAFADRFENC